MMMDASSLYTLRNTPTVGPIPSRELLKGENNNRLLFSLSHEDRSFKGTQDIENNVKFS